jgi:hypothetical protein
MLHAKRIDLHSYSKVSALHYDCSHVENIQTRGHAMGH